MAEPTTMIDPALVWSAVIGQPAAVAQLQAAASRPVHAYLFVGPSGAGKRAAARAFAASLLAADAAARGDDPSRAAELALEESHPDLQFFEPEGASLSVGDADAITKSASRSPVEGGRKVLVLTEFHTIDVAGPKLLKTIEEPPPSTIFVILAEDVPNELVAIASRAVRIDFGPVPLEVLADQLAVEGADHDVALAAAGAAGGDLQRARLLVSDESLVVRRDCWAQIPHRVDGTGHTATNLVDEVRGHIDAAQAPLDERQAAERAALEAQIEEYGMRPTPLKDLDASHKREVRRHRAAELRFGLAVLAGEYRDALVHSPDPGPLVDALARIQDAAEALIRNPNELLLLQALVLSLPPL